MAISSRSTTPICKTRVGYRTGQRRAFNGRGLAIVRATKPGLVRVDASADGLRSASITLHVVPRARDANRPSGAVKAHMPTCVDEHCSFVCGLVPLCCR